MVIQCPLGQSSEELKRILDRFPLWQPRPFQVASFFYNYASFGPAHDAICNKSTSSSLVLEGGSWLFFGARL